MTSLVAGIQGPVTGFKDATSMVRRDSRFVWLEFEGS